MTLESMLRQRSSRRLVRHAAFTETAYYQESSTTGNQSARRLETVSESDEPIVPGQRGTRGHGEIRRPQVHGKFLYVAGKHFWIRGVTYGPFRPDSAGVQFPSKNVVARDFEAIADAGLNAVRIYTAPPRWLLDTA